MRFFYLDKTLGVLCALLLFVTFSPAATKRVSKKAAPAKTRVAATKHVSTASANKTARSTTTRTGKKTRKTKKAAKAKVVRRRGQQAISSERTLEIQEALIREHYLDGEATGTWDQGTKDALVRYQRANGWQSKVLPDSRALIKLGLGPSHSGLLNPDSAAVSSPHELVAEREIPGGSSMPQ
ncbi:MAG TPA: peptidoglycan-binding domain-containing protein [Clostridia bacterium]|nr:peptidoglycan-binding domain-containing protein [Clostridia bacterium]